MKEKTWKDAIREVLASENKPAHYRSVALRIRDQGLRRNLGRSPERTVAAQLVALRRAGEVRALGKGHYALSDEQRTEEMSWKDAIREVLRSEAKDLHYRAIARKIRQRRLRRSFGRTPEQTVAANLVVLRKAGEVLQLGKGIYSVTKEEEQDLDIEAESFQVAAHGLFWKASEVVWGKTRGGQLHGVDPNNENVIVDFSSQEGVYILHHHNTPTAVYVGMTSRSNDGLYERLNAHRWDHLMGRWETFSWFGFRRVNERGELEDAAETVPRRRMIEVIEAILIETLLPSLNRKFSTIVGIRHEQMPLRRR